MIKYDEHALTAGGEAGGEEMLRGGREYRRSEIIISHPCFVPFPPPAPKPNAETRLVNPPRGSGTPMRSSLQHALGHWGATLGLAVAGLLCVPNRRESFIVHPDRDPPAHYWLMQTRTNKEAVGLETALQSASLPGWARGSEVSARERESESEREALVSSPSLLRCSAV